MTVLSNGTFQILTLVDFAVALYYESKQRHTGCKQSSPHAEEDSSYHSVSYRPSCRKDTQTLQSHSSLRRDEAQHLNIPDSKQSTHFLMHPQSKSATTATSIIKSRFHGLMHLKPFYASVHNQIIINMLTVTEKCMR